MGVCACTRGLLLTLLSFVTLGVIFAISLFLVIGIRVYGFDKVDSNLLIAAICSLCSSFFLLIFALYTSCCGGSCSHFLLGVIFLIFAAGIGFITYFLISAREPLLDLIAEKWNSGDASFNTSIANIEEKFNCSTFNKTNPIGGESCRIKLDSYLKRGLTYIGLILGGSALILFIGAIVSIAYVCTKEDKVDQLNQPLSYGW